MGDQFESQEIKFPQDDRKSRMEEWVTKRQYANLRPQKRLNERARLYYTGKDP
jgi:hypothetical protein